MGGFKSYFSFIVPIIPFLGGNFRDFGNFGFWGCLGPFCLSFWRGLIFGRFETWGVCPIFGMFVPFAKKAFLGFAFPLHLSPRKVKNESSLERATKPRYWLASDPGTPGRLASLGDYAPQNLGSFLPPTVVLG